MSQTAPWPEIFGRLAHAARGTKFTRAMQAPLRALAIQGMRATKINRPIAVHLPWGVTFHGILPEAVSSVIWRLGHYEPRTTDYISRTLQEGDTFLDVGSHFGYFSLLASVLVGATGRVFAIEAMPSTFSMTLANLRRNKISNVDALNCAAYSHDTILQFKDFGIVHSSLNTAFNARGALEGVSTAHASVSVRALPMDAMLAKAGCLNVRMIKIDAESSEEYVLQGLVRTLAKQRPIVLLELGGAADDEATRLGTILDFMSAANYAGYCWRDGCLLPMPSTRPLPYDNYVFAHVFDQALRQGCRS